MSDLTPERPADAGVPEKEPADSTAIEAARTLANQAKDELGDAGFDEEVLRRWAETYITETGSGDVPSFVAWIRQQQRSGRH